ncbi:MAG TPA: ATP-binding protein [Bacteroidales bacterium]|nr:ATP-binding protein [Bacteroidales bacterium]HOR81919.1 ATP-binding protein [Bacteroidales bacterium]HPJ91151.1 ATP-binding protein [Bacteroidales bacterium]
MNKEQLNDLLEKLVALPSETEWVEFKLNKGSISNEQIGEYISALSNGATIANKPFGYLVWGINDSSHDIMGTNFSFIDAKQGNQNLELWLRTLLRPKINFEIFEFTYHNQPIVLLRIPSAKSEPTHFQKKAYIRIGSNKTDLMNYPDYIRIIYNSQEDWSAKIIEKASIKDLDQEALKVARLKFKERNTKNNFYNQIDT